VNLRYRDTGGSVPLRVPTLPAAAAMKTVAWTDRQAARDLYDLAGLAKIGALTVEAADLFREATGLRVAPHMVARLPRLDWETQLAHQTRLLPSAEQCLAAVRDAYALALNWPPQDEPLG